MKLIDGQQSVDMKTNINDSVHEALASLKERVFSSMAELTQDHLLPYAPTPPCVSLSSHVPRVFEVLRFRVLAATHSKA